MITACVNVRDDEATIERWVRHVAPHVAEIVVCDTGSADATRSILDRVDEPKLRVVERPWTGFVDGRNAFFEHVRTPLILQLDADELLLQSFWRRLPMVAADLIADVFESARLPHFNARFVAESVAQVERRALDFETNFEAFSYPRDVLYRSDLPGRGVLWTATGGAEVLNVLDTRRFTVVDDPLLHCYPPGHKMLDVEYQARKIITYHLDLGGEPQPQWADILDRFTPQELADMRAAAASDAAHHSRWWAEVGRHRHAGAAAPRSLDTSSRTIFVSVAAYRDPEVGPTVLDALAQADHPDRLRFGICHQDDDPAPSSIVSLPNVSIDHVAPDDSDGACWARARTHRLYDGEDHVLQIDSHMRFEPGWDTTLIEMAERLPVDKPIITTYPGGFEPGSSVDRSQAPNQVVFKRFNDWGCIEYTPSGLAPDELADGPVPARHFCAGFAFAPGSLLDEVPYDPGIYFVGEEASYGARAFTHGYDMFHPDRNVVYHHYVRADRPKHWDDHWSDPDLADRCNELHRQTEARVRHLLGIEPADVDLGPYGLGRERSLADYEAFCGVDFRRGMVDDDANNGRPPPSRAESASIPEWRTSSKRGLLGVLDVGGALRAVAERWHVVIRDPFGSVRREVAMARPDIEQVESTGSDEMVVPYRAYVAGGTWTLTLFDASGRRIDELTGDLRGAGQAAASPPVTGVATPSAARTDALVRLAGALQVDARPADDLPTADVAGARTAVVVLASALPDYHACVGAIRASWGSVDQPGIDVFYLYGQLAEPERFAYADISPWVGPEMPDVPRGSARRRGDVLVAGCADVIWVETDCLLRKRLAAFAHLTALDRYDYVVTVCATSYLSLPALTEFVNGLPAHGVYQGPTGVCQSTGHPYVSGSCIVMSADVAADLAMNGRAILEMNAGDYADDVALARWVAGRFSDTGPMQMARRLAAGERATGDDTFVFPPGFGLLPSASTDAAPMPRGIHYHFGRDAFVTDVDELHRRATPASTGPLGSANA